MCYPSMIVGLAFLRTLSASSIHHDVAHRLDGAGIRQRLDALRDTRTLA